MVGLIFGAFLVAKAVDKLRVVVKIRLELSTLSSRHIHKVSEKVGEERELELATGALEPLEFEVGTRAFGLTEPSR